MYTHHGLHVQLQNVAIISLMMSISSRYYQNLADVRSRSSQITVDKFFYVCASGSLNFQNKVMRIHVMRLHSEDRLLSCQQRSSVQNAHRGLLLDRQILDFFQLGQFRGSDGILAVHDGDVQFVLSFGRLLQFLESVLFFMFFFLVNR